MRSMSLANRKLLRMKTITLCSDNFVSQYIYIVSFLSLSNEMRKSVVESRIIGDIGTSDDKTKE